MLSFTPSAWGHKVNVFVYVQGDKVIVEGYFSGNVKAQDSPVEVLDSKGEKILQGKTNTDGMYSFKLADLPPIKGDMKIVLDAGLGHRAVYQLSADEVHSPTRKTRALSTGVGVTEAKVAREAGTRSIRPVRVEDASVLKRAVAEELDKKIQPILRMLGEQQKLLMEQKLKGPGITEIIGGIGWIFGIVGVWAYLISRKRTEKQ